MTDMENLVINAVARYTGVPQDQLAITARVAGDLMLDSLDVVVLLEEMSSISGRPLDLDTSAANGDEILHGELTLSGLAASVRERTDVTANGERDGPH